MNKHEAATCSQVTFRLPRELDRQMRATSEYFRRSLTEEWRAAGIAYQRLLVLWVATHGGTAAGAATMGGQGEAELISDLCSGVILEPKSLEELRKSLAPLERKER